MPGSREVGAANGPVGDVQREVVPEGPAASPVAITIVHASLDHATFPLMIGAFAGEQLSGVERFVDNQFGGLLSSWVELDRYPSALGSSAFVSPAEDSAPETEPPGCYVIGLGPFIRFGRAELTHAVRAALLDRCLALARDRTQPVGGQLRIGVSSTLIGVGPDDGLRVEDSVAAIVEGVLRANDDLARFESGRSRSAHGVRVAALELVERYAERANLAAVAVRSLATKVRLRDGYDSLRSIIVEDRAGGLPPGASLNEIGARWRRFLITEADDASATARPAEGSRSLALDVALLGREARADRVRHHIDAAAVDALLDELSTNPGDRRTAATLYEQLVPEALEGEFQTSAGVQFVVDAVTAKFPWELLTAPRASGGAALAESGSVMRQFAESEERRLNPTRSAAGRALVVAAGRVPGLPELPGVYGETQRVAELLRASLGKSCVELLDDGTAPLGLVDVHNALFGDHQILHIAAHGVYRAGEPDGTGAVLSAETLLTSNLVRQLRSVPDVVFLNCCSLGKVGMSRMAAGLAREFMAIGVRALVAAAWSVDDAAAKAFAVTFYEELVNGRSLGDAAARARVACARAGAGETWAAYQCYGDPGFVMRGARQPLNAAVAAPVSESDLSSRLDSLAVRTADLGLAGRGPVGAARRRLEGAWEDLATWVAEHPRFAGESVERRLGLVARDLGNFRAAATRLCRLVVGDGRIGLRTRAVVPADLQQAANCLARAAQQEAQRALTAGDRWALDAALADLDLAADIARAAIDVLPELESYAVLASTLRRRATVDAGHRDALLSASLCAYRDGAQTHPDGGTAYGRENAWQLALLVQDADAGTIAADLDSEAPVADAGEAEGDRLVDQRRAPPADFWTRAHPGDRALTRTLAAPDDETREAAAKSMAAAYDRAFATRSTWSQRQTVLATIRDLHDLLPEDDARRPCLATALRELTAWDE